MRRFQEEKTQLDLKTFAQINNDVESRGTELEGNDLKKTASFFISFLQKKEIAGKQELIQKLEKLRDLTIEIDKPFSENLRVVGKEEAINSKVNAIVNRALLNNIFALEDNKSILIPGGWISGSNSGHVMIYELRKTKDCYLFIIYNSGEGIDNHQIKKEASDKIRYAPIKVYEFRLEEMWKGFLADFIKELIKPQINIRTIAFDCKKVYKLFDSLLRIGATEVCPYEKNIIKREIASSGQHSGSCAQKILHAFLKVHLNDRKSYNQLIYSFKKYSIECYLQKETLTSIDLEQIKLAIENIARKLYKVGDAEFKSTENGKIILLSKQHKEALAKLKDSPLEQSNSRIEFSESFKIDLPESKESSSTVHSKRIRKRQAVAFNFDAENWMIELEQFVSNLGERRYCKPSSVEGFYLNFPLDKPIRHKFPQEINKANLLTNLEKIYDETSDNDNSKARALNVIRTAVCSKIFSDVIALHKPGDGDFLRAIRFDFSRNYYFECAILNGCHDYQWDAQLMRAVGMLFEQDVTKIPDLDFGKISFIKSIISKYDIEEELNELFQAMLIEPEYDKYVEEERDLGYLSKSMYVILYIIWNFPNLSDLDYVVQTLKLEKQEDFTRKLKDINKDFDLFKRMIKVLKLDYIDTTTLRFDNFVKPGMDNYFMEYFRHRPFVDLKYEGEPSINNFMKKILENNYISLQSQHFLPTPNDIQLECSRDENISPSDLQWVKRFQQISASVFRLPEIIRLFFGEMQVYLLDTQKQIFLEKCIFGPMYLARAMQKNESIIQELYSYMDKSINQYIIGTDPKEKAAALFLMRLKSKIISYNLDYYNLNDIQYPENFIRKYDDHIVALDKIIADESFSFESKRELMFCKIIMLNSFRKEDKSQLVAQILEYNLSELPLRDAQDRLMVGNIMNNLSLDINQFKSFLSMFLENKFPNKKYRLEGEYTYIDIYDNQDPIGWASLDNFKLYIKGMSEICELPYSIISNDKFKKAVGKCRPKAKYDPKSCTYEFVYEGNTYKVDCSNGRDIRILVNFHNSGTNDDFELQDNRSLYTSLIPTYLLPDTVNIWLHKSSIIMHDKDNDRYYFAELEKDSKITEKDKSFRDKGNLILLESFDKFNAIEPTPHVKVIKNDQQIIICLSRYDLVFIYNVEDKSYKLQDTDLELIDHEPVIKGFKQQLVVKKGERKFFLLPVAEFILDEEDKTKDDRGFKKLKLDLNQYIQRSKTNNRHLLWVNNNPFKVRYIKLEIKNGQLFPMNMSDGLYLSYVYLATNNYQQAFDMLEYVKTNFRMIAGTDNEIDYIIWIISSLPAQMRGDNVNKRINPSIVSVQLKALELLIAFKNENRKFKPVYSPIDNLLSHNIAYDKKLYEKRKDFFDQAETQIPRIIEFYYKCMRNIQKPMRLSESELYTLLNAINVPLSPPIKFFKECLNSGKNEGRLFSYNEEKKVDENNFLLPRFFDWPYNDLKNESKEPSKGIDFIQQVFCKFELSLDEIKDNFIDILNAIDNARKEHKEFLSSLLGGIIYDPKYKDNKAITYLYAFVNTERKLGFFDRKQPAIYHENLQVSRKVLERQSLTIEGIQVPGLPAKKRVDILEDKCSVKEHCLIKEEIIKSSNEFDMLFYKPWTTACEETRKENETLKANYIDLQKQPQTYEARSIEENALDQKAGMLLHKLEQSHFSLCTSALVQYITPIQELCVSKKNGLTQQLNGIKDDIVSSANKEFNSKVIGQRNSKITFELLIKLFGRNDKNYYQEITFLTEDEVTELHSKIANYITEHTHLAHYERIIKLIDEIHKLDKTNPVYTSSLYKLGVMLNEKNLVNTTKDPEMQLFQYDQGIFIRQDQLESINSLLEKKEDGSLKNKIIQLIMGAGKTTVLLNILALKRADGTNLSIIEVPEPLYESNLASLNNITYRLYGKKPFGFKFDRDTPCGKNYLEKLYFKFKKIMSDREYIVTTKSSIACLELKYQTLFNECKNIGNDTTELYWLHKIMKLLKEQGDCLVDEVHKSLDLRQEINFTLGEKQELPGNDIKKTCELFNFMDEVEIKSEQGLTPLSAFFNDPDGFSENCKHLAYALVNHENSPLCLEIEKKEKAEIENYLLGKTANIPSILNTLDKNKSDEIKLYRGQILKLLLHTLGLSYRVHYGPSNAKNKDIIERQVSIPYAGNEEPKENSQNTNYFKTINLTIQGMLISGVSKDLLRFLVEKWHKIAVNSVRLQNGRITIDQSEISKEVSAVLGQNLSEVCNCNIEEFQKFAFENQHNKKIIFYILEKEILPTITLEKKIATLNSINYVDIFRSLCGVTGTPNNFRTMNPKIEFDQSSSLGTDGLTCARLKTKKTNVIRQDFKGIQTFMSNLVQESSNLRAIIDVAPIFKGIENNKVAVALCQFISKYKDRFSCEIKYLIYFDKQFGNQMAEPFALHISFSNLESDRIPLKGMSKSDIRARLDSGPENWFIYFDQLRTMGTDFELMPNAHAIITLEQGSKINDFAQGVNRLRDLKGQQTVTVVVPHDMPTEIDTIISLCSNNLSNSLIEEHFDAACAILSNFVRNFLRDMSLNLIDVRYPENYNIAFEAFFFKEQVKSLIEQYGEIEETTKTEYILTKIMNNALGYLDEDIKRLLMPQMQEYIRKAVKNCAEFSVSQKNTLGFDAQSEQKAQVEQESKSEQQQKTQSQKCSYSILSSICNDYKWISNIRDKEFNIWPECLLRTKEFFTWPRDWPSGNNDFSKWPSFSCLDKDIIYASSSQIKTLDYNDSMNLLKELQMVMLVQMQGKTNAFLINYYEAAYMKHIIENRVFKAKEYVWLANIKGNFIAGKAPDNDNHTYIFEIINYYQGNIDYLLDKDMTKSVLFEDLNNNLTVLEKIILPCRLHDPTALERSQYLYRLLEEILANVALGKDIDKSKFSLLNDETKTTVERFKKFIGSIKNGNATDPTDHEFTKGIFAKLYKHDRMPKSSPAAPSPAISPAVSLASSPAVSPAAPSPAISPAVSLASSPAAPSPAISPAVSPDSSPAVSPAAPSPAISPAVSPKSSPAGSPAAIPDSSPAAPSPDSSPAVSLASSPAAPSPAISPAVSLASSPAVSPAAIPKSSPAAPSPAISPAVSPAISPAAPSPDSSPAVSLASSPAVSPAVSLASSPAVSPDSSPAASPVIPPLLADMSEPLPVAKEGESIRPKAYNLRVGFYLSLSLFIIFTSSIFVFIACLKRNIQKFFNNFKFDLVHKVTLILILLSAVSAIATLYLVSRSSMLKSNVASANVTTGRAHLVGSPNPNS